MVAQILTCHYNWGTALLPYQKLTISRLLYEHLSFSPKDPNPKNPNHANLKKKLRNPVAPLQASYGRRKYSRGN